MKIKNRPIVRMQSFGQPAGSREQRLRWYTISIGAHRAVRCECGGGVIDRPHANKYDGIACTHILALYLGTVTENTREAHNPEIDGIVDLSRATNRLVRFTLFGKKMFYPRYTVKALKGG